MDSRKLVLSQTGSVLVGQLIGIAVMFGIFALLGKFDYTVLLGGLAGLVLAVGNFFALAVVATLAADKAEAQDVAGGQKLIHLSYLGRMIGMFLVLILCAKSGYFHPLALVLPLAFNRPILTIAELFKKKGENKA